MMREPGVVRGRGRKIQEECAVPGLASAAGPSPGLRPSGDQADGSSIPSEPRSWSKLSPPGCLHPRRWSWAPTGRSASSETNVAASELPSPAFPFGTFSILRPQAPWSGAECGRLARGLLRKAAHLAADVIWFTPISRCHQVTMATPPQPDPICDSVED
jgi:hypothetical protein